VHGYYDHLQPFALVIKDNICEALRSGFAARTFIKNKSMWKMGPKPSTETIPTLASLASAAAAKRLMRLIALQKSISQETERRSQLDKELAFTQNQFADANAPNLLL
jgi:hypothetical protein